MEKCLFLLNAENQRYGKYFFEIHKPFHLKR